MIAWAGEVAGFATALLWAFGALASAAAGRRIGAMAVNLVRIPIAVVLLAASGVVGLSLGDLFCFHALAALGPRLSALLLATWPVAGGLLGAGCQALGLIWSKGRTAANASRRRRPGRRRRARGAPTPYRSRAIRTAT